MRRFFGVMLVVVSALALSACGTIIVPETTAALEVRVVLGPEEKGPISIRSLHVLDSEDEVVFSADGSNWKYNIQLTLGETYRVIVQAERGTLLVERKITMLSADESTVITLVRGFIPEILHREADGLTFVSTALDDLEGGLNFLGGMFYSQESFSVEVVHTFFGIVDAEITQRHVLFSARPRVGGLIEDFPSVVMLGGTNTAECDAYLGFYELIWESENTRLTQTEFVNSTCRG